MAIKFTFQNEKETKRLETPGTYNGTVIKAEEDRNAAGDDVINITLRTDDFETIRHRFTLSAKAAVFFEFFLKKIGLLEGLQKGDVVELKPEHLINQRVKFKADFEEGKDGKQYLKIKRFEVADPVEPAADQEPDDLEME